MTTIEAQALWFKSYVQTLLTKMLGHDVEPDSDGDFPVRGETAYGWVRAEAAGLWGVHIFVYAAHGVPAKAALLKEINEINLTEPLVKLLLHDGTVLVTLRLLADAVTPENLEGAVSRALQVADRVGPLLVAVHGGQTALSSSTQLAIED
jgi:hypothetical protein